MSEDVPAHSIPARYGPLQALLDKLKADKTTGGTNR
jgi:hypothetical protein